MTGPDRTPSRRGGNRRRRGHQGTPNQTGPRQREDERTVIKAFAFIGASIILIVVAMAGISAIAGAPTTTRRKRQPLRGHLNTRRKARGAKMTPEDMYRHYLENQMLTTVLKDCDGRAAMAALNALPTLLHWTITDPVISTDRGGATLEFHKPGEDAPTLRVTARREGGLTAETGDGKTAKAEDVYSFLTQADIMRAATDLAQAAAEATPRGMGLVEVRTMGRYTEPIIEITSRKADVLLKRTEVDAYGLQVENQGFIFRLETDGRNDAKLIMRGEDQEWEPSSKAGVTTEMEELETGAYSAVTAQEVEIKVTRLDEQSFYAAIGGNPYVIGPMPGHRGRTSLKRMMERERLREFHENSLTPAQDLAEG